MDYDHLQAVEEVLDDVVRAGRAAARYRETEELVDLPAARRELNRVRERLERYEAACEKALECEYERSV